MNWRPPWIFLWCEPPHSLLTVLIPLQFLAIIICRNENVHGFRNSNFYIVNKSKEYARSVVSAVFRTVILSNDNALVPKILEYSVQWNYKCLNLLGKKDNWLTLWVSPQKKSYWTIFFKLFPKCFLPRSVSKNIMKQIGHLSCLRDTMIQTYPTYACSGTNNIHG